MRVRSGADKLLTEVGTVRQEHAFNRGKKFGVREVDVLFHEPDVSHQK